MLTYKIGEAVGRDEEDFNKIFFGRPMRYKTFDLDYKTNFKAPLISENIKMFISAKDEYKVLNSDIALQAVTEHIAEILCKCFELRPEKIFSFEPNWDSVKESIGVLKDCAQSGGLSGWLANLELSKITKNPKKITYKSLLKPIEQDIIPLNGKSEEAKEKRNKFMNFLSFLMIIDKEAEFSCIIPVSMYEQIKDFMRFAITILAEGYQTEIPTDLLANIKYKKATHPNPEKEASKITSVEGIRIVRNMIIINGFEFRTIKDKEFLEKLLSYEDKSILRMVCFQDCCFNSDNNALIDVCGDIQFQNCRFDKNFKAGFVLEGKIHFDQCVFFSKLDLKALQFNVLSSVCINYSFFEKGSSCDLSNIHGLYNNTRFVRIKNTHFDGELKLNNVREQFFVEMKNVSFSCPFLIQNVKIHPLSEFENLCFSSIPSIQMDKSRKDLYEVMKTAGLEQQAKDLGILPIAKETNETKFDYDAYQAAYNSGFLKPEYAAYFLGKSKVYLAKKRTEDKKKTTRDSIPFKVDGKDIQYPVEALLAFKAKDWDTLKNLRKKYPIPTK